MAIDVAREIQEQRKEPRRSVGKALLKLDIGKGHEPFVCFVWDISDNGARLKVPENVEIPKIVYVISEDSRWPAAVVWRKGNQIGLEFFPIAAK